MKNKVEMKEGKKASEDEQDVAAARKRRSW